jgi:hypothetical protein
VLLSRPGPPSGAVGFMQVLFLYHGFGRPGDLRKNSMLDTRGGRHRNMSPGDWASGSRRPPEGRGAFPPGPTAPPPSKEGSTEPQQPLLLDGAQLPDRLGGADISVESGGPVPPATPHTCGDGHTSLQMADWGRRPTPRNLKPSDRRSIITLALEQ